MADTELKLVITAENADALKKVKEFADNLDGVTTATKKAKDSQESLATSVFKGQAAWDMLKTGLKSVEGFVIDSAKAFIESENQMSLVRSTVESLGITYDSVKPQIEEFSQKMAGLGVDDEQAALSMVKLAKAAGGDFAKGMQLAKLASDLTASGIGDLESNTDNLQKILIGKGARALLEYKINLDDTATTAEQLNAVQKKVTRTTEELATTTEGKLKIMQEAYTNLKEEIGGGFIAAINNAITGGENLNKAVDNVSEAGKEGKVAMFSFTNALIAAGEMAIVLTKGLVAPLEYLGSFYIRLTEGKEAAKAFRDSIADSLVGSLDSFNTAIGNAISPVDGLTRAQKLLEDQSKNTGKSQEQLKIEVENANKASADALKAHKQKVQDLKDKYDEATSKISDDLTTLETNHKEKMDSISDSITKAKKSISDLDAAYYRARTEDTQSVADKIVESEKKVADLQKQINEETSSDKRIQLQKDLEEEQRNLQSASQWKIDNTTAITEAERRAGLTDLQRTIEDYIKKRMLAQQELQDKKTQLAQEILDLEEKNKKEIAMYEDKVVKIQEQLKKEVANYKKAMEEETAALVTSTTAQTAAVNALAAAKARAGMSGGSTSGGGNNGNIDSSGMALQAPGGMPHFAEGGIVDGPTVALVGEAGPEAIIPLNRMGRGGGNITVNINGGYYLDRDAAKKIGDTIINELRLQMRI